MSKRIPERIYVEWNATFRPRGATTKPASTIDISKSGVLFSSESRLRVGELVQMDVITSPNSFFRSMARVERFAYRNGRRSVYGARFVDMTSVDREILNLGIRKTKPAVVAGVQLA